MTTYRSFDEVPLVITVPDLAAILNISRNTAYEIVRCGQIRSMRAGTQIRISKKALQEYLSAA